MKKTSAALPFASIATAAMLHVSLTMAADSPITLVIHGGAGIAREELPAEREAAC